MDPLSAAADEVALEGLDGITIPTLWIRLESRRPAFPLKLDDCTKELIWRSLLSNSELTFHELPGEREDVVLIDRFKYIDPETGIQTKSLPYPKKDIYPVHIVLENKNGLQGSCALFKERKDITKHVRSKSLTALVNLEEALERYGRRIVVVACQVVRFRTLIGAESDPDLKLNDHSYCLLERVGRARWQGELQSELHGSYFKTDARKLHYMRKAIVKHGLITMQSHVTRMKTGQQQHSILLLLKRFHVNRRSKYDILMERVSDLIQPIPAQFATMVVLKKQLNVSDSVAKRVFQYMRTAKLVEFCQFSLEELDPSAKSFFTKKGKKVMIRCVRLLKPYSQKGVVDDDDDEDDDEEYETGKRRRAFRPEGRIMEKEVLSQAYNIVESGGTKGTPKADIGYRMNVSKLESRMICRRLERDELIKGFMVDEGRQRTTKYISHKCVGVSDQLQLFAKEQERQKLLYSSGPNKLVEAPEEPPAKAARKRKKKHPAVKKIKPTGEDAEEREAEQARGAGKMEMGVGELDEGEEKSTAKEGNQPAKETQPETPEIQRTTAAECEIPACSSSSESSAMTPDVPTADQAAPEEGEQSSLVSACPAPETEASAKDPAENQILVFNDTPSQQISRKTVDRSQQTYRVLRRKNLIVEAVRSLKVIDGLFPLQKMINDAEKQDGCLTKCCKKTISRLVHGLSREGLLKFYRTTVIQDGITKKVEMVVHPSVHPNDELVHRLIEQVRFRISSSYTAVRMQQEEERNREEEESLLQDETPRKDKADRKATCKEEEDFKPTPVRGLGKSLGFQPKMHRLRVVHTFLWYLIYGHPLRHGSAGSTRDTLANLHSSNPEAKVAPHQEKQDPADKPSSNDAPTTQLLENANSTELDLALGDEEEEQRDEATLGTPQCALKVFADEESWRKYIPPVRVRKEFSSGWVMVGDLLLCLPLSIFIQVIQINYKVDGLEEYLNDPVKQHHLVRVLPARMRRQLLYKRKYLFSFHENLQKLVYMGLLQFGPLERFKEKDQVFLFLRRNTTIVDTTNAEPHYWLVTESPDKPFERRKYTFNTGDDVENYWFDLMCVCLNTPLGVIRNKRNAREEDSAPSFMHERSVFVGLAYLLKGSNDICDDGLIPGDGKGAAGLDSEFFAHLKRNWLWTNHLLSVKPNTSTSEAKENNIRLKSLLSKNALRFAFKAARTTAPHYVTTKLALGTEAVEVGIEPATRNLRVMGGKKQKRKRIKEEVVKVPRKKKKEPKKRLPAHDEADHRALKMMTRQRVYWSVQEDSLMMLCSVASQLLNSKLKRPFVPYCVVRDLLQAEFEIAMDKTSLAVGRRTRYILKNPQTLLNYRICLTEAYQDKALMKVLEEKKPSDPDKPEICAEAFSEYTRLLRQKFSSVLSICDMMPDTKQELFSRFKLSTIESRKPVSGEDAVNCKDDIHSIVLHNLIQSTLAMTNNQMKSTRSFQTFHAYSKYSQELLCQVFLQCRKRGLINRRRVNQPFGPKKNRSLPILPMSYQLSQSFYRCFSWRFPFMLCTDSFRFLRTLISNGTGEDRPVTQFCRETENRSDDGEVVATPKVSKRKETPGGGKVGGEPASEADAQPESTKEGEKGQERPVGGEEMPMEVDANKTDEAQKPEDGLPAVSGENPSIREQTEDHLQGEEPSSSSSSSSAATAAPEVSQDPPDVSDMMAYTLDSPGGACMASLSLMSLGLLSVYVSIPKQVVVVDSTLVDKDVAKSMAALEEEEDDDDEGEECEGAKKMEVKSHQASHTKFLMMRGFCCPGIVKIRNLNTSDNIVVESCILKLQLRDTPSHHMFRMENSPPLDLFKSCPAVLPSTLTSMVSFSSSSSSSSSHSLEECDGRLVEHRGYTPQDLEACARLRRSLHEAGEKGLYVDHLHRAHEHQEEARSGRTRSFQQYAEDLQEEGQVLKVGAMGARYVLMRHAEPWLLTLNSKQLSSQSKVTSDKIPFIKKRQTNKRGRQEDKPEAGGQPPAKKAAADRDEREDRRDAEGGPKETTGEKPDQEESTQEGSGEKQAEVTEGEEGGKETRKEDEEETKVETEEKAQEKRNLRSSKKKPAEESGSSGFTDADENVSFISRPWRLVDGKVNRLVCKGMLEAVLYHIMSQPGLTQEALTEHYKKVLQPMAVLDLVQALLDTGCITKKRLVKSAKPSLFTRFELPTRSEPPTMEEPDTVFYEPTISCCLRLGRLLPNERHWNYSIP